MSIVKLANLSCFNIVSQFILHLFKLKITSFTSFVLVVGELFALKTFLKCIHPFRFMTQFFRIIIISRNQVLKMGRERKSCLKFKLSTIKVETFLLYHHFDQLFSLKKHLKFSSLAYRTLIIEYFLIFVHIINVSVIDELFLK